MVSGRSVGIVGAGPAGLMAAEILAGNGVRATVYEKMPSPGRKLLMAGRGGLNLTHSEPLDAFLSRYGEAPPALLDAVRAFPPDRLVAWAQALGQETFVGTSGRVFPRGLKASPLLRAWLQRLATLGVTVRTAHDWRGWCSSGALAFDTPQGPLTATHDAVLLAMGGASWPRLGSDGRWTGILSARGIAVCPLTPSNCGVTVPWSQAMKPFAGKPLKRISLSADDSFRRGEVIITQTGLEGGALYAVLPGIRRQLITGPTAALDIDLRPDATIAALRDKLSEPRGKQSTSTFLRKQLRLAPPAIALLYEARTGRLPTDPDALARLVKSVPVTVSGLTSIDRAISTAGGLPFSELDENGMIRRLPGVFAAGEMLDWDAPTGGYLLQACFATGAAAAAGILAVMARETPPSEHSGASA